MHQDIEKTLLSEAQIAARVQELGKIIARDYAELGDLVMIGGTQRLYHVHDGFGTRHRYSPFR